MGLGILLELLGLDRSFRGMQFTVNPLRRTEGGSLIHLREDEVVICENIATNKWETREELFMGLGISFVGITDWLAQGVDISTYTEQKTRDVEMRLVQIGLKRDN